MRPESGGASQAAERLLIVGEGAEEGAGKPDPATAPGSQTTGPVGHEGIVARGANPVAGLTDGLVINAENEIGMRNLAAKLPFLALRQIPPVTLILDHLQRARSASHAGCCAEPRGPRAAWCAAMRGRPYTWGSVGGSC